MDKRWLCGWSAVTFVLLAAALVLAQARESLVGEWEWTCCKDANGQWTLSGKINIQTQQPDGTFQGTFTGAAGGVVNGKITGDVVTFHRTGYTCCEDCLQKGQKDQSWEGHFVGTTRTAIEGHWTGCRQEQFPNRDFRLSIY